MGINYFPFNRLKHSVVEGKDILYHIPSMVEKIFYTILGYY